MAVCAEAQAWWGGLHSSPMRPGALWKLWERDGGQGESGPPVAEEINSTCT